jgi:ribosome biogenesis protein ERB1
VKPVVCVEWNPNSAHHCLLAAVGKCVLIIATGTGDAQACEITDALLAAASSEGGVTTSAAKVEKAVQWMPMTTGDEAGVSAFSKRAGLVSALVTKKEVASVRWHVKGDYFVSVSPKAGASAVLIHQLSKGRTQQPFRKAKGEAQLACFHPNKPFLFVASQQHVRVYHLVKQSMVKRLISGCRWISSLDVHPSGDHVIVGSLDRRMVWFDLDLSNTPYKTLKYHERALRSVGYHQRYPLMASAADDGVIHVFHSMVYSDLMRNPLLVPV